MASLTPASSLVNLKPCPTRISRDAFKLGISGEQDVRTTAISSLLSRFHSHHGKKFNKMSAKIYIYVILA